MITFGELQSALDHWIGVADTLKQQRDQAEKERDAMRKDADIVRRARARSSVVVEVTPELLTKDAFTAQPLHVMLTDNGDGTHLLTFRESEELHTLRAERDEWKIRAMASEQQRQALRAERDALRDACWVQS
jgi:uncharacterized protein YfaT (DUF1175 family)